MKPGDRYHVHIDEADLIEAPAMPAHDWIISAVYRVTQSEAAATHEGVTQLLDVDHLAFVTSVGCFRCEQPWTPALAARQCRGEPVGHTRDGVPIYRTGQA